jgi:hypothetical protein
MKTKHNFYLIIILISLASPAWGNQDDFQKRFEAEYQSAAIRCEAFYGQLTGSGILNHYVVKLLSAQERKARFNSTDGARVNTQQTGGTLLESSNFRFAFNGPLKKVISRSVVEKRIVPGEPPRIEDFPKGAGEALEVAHCAGRDVSFRVRWLKEGGPPLLADFEKATPGGQEIPIANIFGDYIKNVYKVAGFARDEVFPNPPFVIRRVTSLSKDGVALARVEFEFKRTDAEIAKNKGRRITSGWFVARPDENWVIQEYQASTPSSSDFLNIKVDFEGKEDGFPLPKRITRYTAVGRYEVILDSIQHRPTPESEFTLAAFGLPEIDRTPRPASPNLRAYWLIAIGVVVFIVAIGLKVYSRRLQTNATK